MLTLNDGRTELWQWDTGRKLTVDADCSQVHFSNKVFGRSIDVDVVDGVAIIPDIMLQTDKDLNVWAFVGKAENGYTKISKTFKVNKRNKPADYVFTPQDQSTLGEILDRIEDLENRPSGDVSKEDIQNAVNDYLDKNPVSFEEKDPTVPDWAKQPNPPSVDIPKTLPNPHKLTFTGAVTAEYDGSEAVEVKIPEGGSGIEVTGAEVGQTIVVKAVDEKGIPTEWETVKLPSELPLINKVILAEEVSDLRISTDTEGNAFDVTEFEFRAYIPNTASAIGVEAYMQIPTWVNLLSPKFKTDGHNIIIAKTMGTPHWVELKAHSYRSPQYDASWADGVEYVETERHVSVFGLANWSGVLPVGTFLEVYGK